MIKVGKEERNSKEWPQREIEDIARTLKLKNGDGQVIQ